MQVHVGTRCRPRPVQALRGEAVELVEALDVGAVRCHRPAGQVVDGLYACLVDGHRQGGGKVGGVRGELW